MFKKTIIFSLFSIMVSTLFSDASAYTLRVTNATNEAIGFDINGVGVIGGSMMQGKITHISGKKIWKKVRKGGTTYYKNAGAIPLSRISKIDKPIIQPGDTAVLEFTDIDVGVCFDFSNISVGLQSNNYSMRPREVKFADSASFNSVMDSVEAMGGDISTIGKGVGELDGKAKAVGVALQGIGGIWSKTTKAAKGSGCRNLSMIVVKTEVSANTGAGFTIGDKLGVFVLR